MRPNWSSLHQAVSIAVAFALRAVERILTTTRSAIRDAWHALRRFLRPVRSRCGTAYTRAGETLSGPVKDFVCGPLRVALFGMRQDISLLVVLVSPVLALGTAWWVDSRIGYETLTVWVRGTWFGTDPSLVIFLAVAGLLALGAISAGVNSGLLPTGILVSAPVFGAAVTQYATTATYSWGEQVVSLPEAVGMAFVSALGFGVPIAVVGFVLGSGLRRVARVLGGRSGPSSKPDRA